MLRESLRPAGLPSNAQVHCHGSHVGKRKSRSQIPAHLAPQLPCFILKRDAQLGSAVSLPLRIREGRGAGHGDSRSFSDPVGRHLRVPAAAHMIVSVEAVWGVGICALPACRCGGQGLRNVGCLSAKSMRGSRDGSMCSLPPRGPERSLASQDSQV